MPDEEIKRQRLARARLLSRTGQSAQALEMALAIDDRAHRTENLRSKARCSVDIAWYHFQLGQAESVYSYARWAVEFWKDADSPSEEAEARSIAGWFLL